MHDDAGMHSKSGWYSAAAVADVHAMQATVNLATETALVRTAMPDESEGHAERLEGLGRELVQVRNNAQHV